MRTHHLISAVLLLGTLIASAQSFASGDGKLEIVRLGYSAHSIVDGGELKIVATVRNHEVAAPSGCIGNLGSADLSIGFPMESCTVTAVTGGLYQINVSYTFPKETANRFYYLQSLRVWGKDGKGFWVNEKTYGGATRSLIGVTSSKVIKPRPYVQRAWLETTSGRSEVRVGESYQIKFLVEIGYPLSLLQYDDRDFEKDKAIGMSSSPQWKIPTDMAPKGLKLTQRIFKDAEGQLMSEVTMRFSGRDISIREGLTLQYTGVQFTDKALQQAPYFAFPDGLKVKFVK